MAKQNNTCSSPDPNEARRKAIGNPNKNKHHKKNGSNYHPDRPAAQPITSPRTPQQQAWANLPSWAKVLFFVMLFVLILVLILRVAVFPESLLMSHIASLALGLACVGLFFMRRQTGSKSGTPANIFNLVLIGMGLLYLYLGAAGLYTLLTA